jgi:hypothetical protein
MILKDTIRSENFYNGNKKDVSPSYKNTKANNNNVTNNSSIAEINSQRLNTDKNKINLKSTMGNMNMNMNNQSK